MEDKASDLKSQFLLSESSSEDDVTKFRTPSGNQILHSVKEISKIFAEGEEIANGANSLGAVQSGQCSLNSQPKQQRKKKKRKLSKQAERKLKSRAEKVASKHNKVYGPILNYLTPERVQTPTDLSFTRHIKRQQFG